MIYRYSDQRGALQEGSAAPPPAATMAGGWGSTPATGRHGAPATMQGPGPGGLPVLAKYARRLPEDLARELAAIPMIQEGETVVVAVDRDPVDIALADRLSAMLGAKVRLERHPRAAVLAAINRHYAAEAAPPGPRVHTYGAYADAVEADESFHTMSLSSMAASPAAWRQGGEPGEGRERLYLPASRASMSTPAPRRSAGASGMARYVVEDGQRVLMTRPDGTIDVLVGPRRVWGFGRRFRPMDHHVAHPGEFLMVRYRDGRQDHLVGPAEVWFDPRLHQAVGKEDGLQLAAKEAVVVYSNKEGTEAVQRRIVHGPALFVPRPGEWLHTFSWHASQGGSRGVVKIPNGLVFQKLWLMPDQMYHDVSDVRTADDAVLTIRLMIFFELLDITKMLDTTHDPIGDFVNAASSDVVDFTGRHDFEAFKRHTEHLNELGTYRQLAARADQCGYRINKVVYRGYGAPDRLQQMHDQAIEARTKLVLDRDTERQAQGLEDFKLESQLTRATRRRTEQAAEAAHDLELSARRHEADLRDREARAAFDREQARRAAEVRDEVRRRSEARRREHLAALAGLGVDLTALLTQGRPDRVIEVRGRNRSTHLHLDAHPPGPPPGGATG